MNIQQTIRKVLREELYSPAGKEYKPSKVVVHKSNPVWRDNIKLTGLQTSVGDCYQQYVGGDIECKESIFATDSLIEKDMFDSTYDDDIWLIDTECAGVTWYKDRHFDNGDYEHHIVTFEDISPDCLKLIYKGSGKSEDFIQESIRKVLREESQIPSSVRRRMRYNEEDIINYLKKFAIRTFQYDKKIDVVVSKACRNTAYEILDSTHTSIDDEIFNSLENKLTYYLKDKYGEQIKEFINSFFDSSGDELGDVYTFWKHADRNGGNGFSESFETWNMLLRKYADWFPDLDWAEIKIKLDDKSKLLIKEPTDKNNTMGYYFSLIKRKV